jgi:uncharacterized protein (DUF1697 family)
VTTRIALLRGINVGGKNKIGMGDLRKMASEMGFSDPRTLLQSGNLVFGCEDSSDAELEAMLEEKTLASFGLHLDYHVRGVGELETVVKANPYPREAVEDPSHLVVAFFKETLSPSGCDSLRSAIRGREIFHAAGREVYFVYPDGIGESKLTNSLMDSKLGQRGTARNWNTVLKLMEMGK